MTVVDAIEIIPGPPGTHPAGIQGEVVSVDLAAGLPPIITVGAPLIIVCGVGGCGKGVGTGAAG